MTTILLDHHRFVPPLASDFGTIIGTNAQNPTLTDAQTSPARGLVMDFGTSPAAGFNNRCAVRAKTAGSSQDIILRQRPMIFSGSFNMGAGIVLRDSGTGKLVTWGLHNNGLNALQWSSPTGTATQIGTLYSPQGGMDIEWWKITLVADDPKRFYVSRNGTDWFKPFADASQTAFFTFNQVGIYVFVNDTGPGVNGTDNKLTNSILYFKDAGIVPGV